MPRQKQIQSMQQEYQPDSNLSAKENTLLKRLHNKDETLEEIDLRKTFFSHRKFKQKLYKGLETNNTVKRLIFSETYHNHDALAKVFEKNTTITHVDLSHCSIDIDGNHLEKLARALRLNQNTKITHLNLSYNEISRYCEGLEQLGLTLQSNSTITHLDLKGNNLNNRRGVKEFLNGLEKNSSITHLDLSDTYVGYIGQDLGNMFKNNSTIEDINLTDTRINDKEALKMFNGLVENSTIKSINLAANFLRGSSVELLGNVLRNNTAIINLNLSSNALFFRNGSSIKIFLDGLSNNKSIRNLNLKDTKCGDEGAIALAEVLKQNSTITHLDLGLNKIREVGIIYLSYALRMNKTIKELNLERNIHFSVEIAESLEMFFKLNNIDSRVINIKELSNKYIKILEILKRLFLNIMIPRVLDPNKTDAYFMYLSTMQKSTIAQNIKNRMHIQKYKKKKKIPSEQTSVSLPVNMNRFIKPWEKHSDTSQSEATNIYDQIHHTNDYFTFYPNKRDSVKKQEEQIWYKFNEYLLITKQQLTLDTYVPQKLLLQLFVLYIDNDIIEIKDNFYNIGKENVLENLGLVVAIDYMNILHHFLPVDEMEKLITNLFQTQSSSRTQKQTSSSSSSSSSTQRQIPYYKKLEKKLFELHYENIINKITQNNNKKIIGSNDILQIEKQLTQKRNELKQLEHLSQTQLILKKSKKQLTEKQELQKQDLEKNLNHRKKVRDQVENLRKRMNIMINNKKMNQLKQNLSQLVVQSKTINQNRQIQRKILDNMLPETFLLKYFNIRKRKFKQQQQQIQHQKTQKQSSSKKRKSQKRSTKQQIQKQIQKEIQQQQQQQQQKMKII
jgi:hypothetical protein